MSDKLASLEMVHLWRKGMNDMEVLKEMIDRVDAVTLLALQTERIDSMEKRFYWSAIRGTQWGQHAEKSRRKSMSFHQYMDKLFASIRTLGRHNEDSNHMRNSNGILYIGQKEYGRHPSYVAIVRLNSLLNDFPSSQKETIDIT